MGSLRRCSDCRRIRDLRLYEGECNVTRNADYQNRIDHDRGGRMSTTTTARRRNAPRICEDCGQPFPVDAPPVDCYHCEAERRRERARLDRGRREAEERARLGTAPLTRSVNPPRIGPGSAAEGWPPGLRNAEGEKARAWPRANQLVRVHT